MAESPPAADRPREEAPPRIGERRAPVQGRKPAPERSGGVAGLAPYLHLLGAQLRSQASYRTSFVIELVGNASLIVLDLITVLVMFRITPVLGTFDVRETILIFALGNSSYSLADLTVGNIERLRRYVRTGLFDTVLIRPLGALPQLMVVDAGLHRMGRAASSVGLLVVALCRAGVPWTPARVLLAVLAPLTGAVFFSAIFVAGSSVAFWWIESGELANSVTYGGRDFTAYPITVYGRWFRRIFGYAIGFGFIAYYPALYLLDRPDPLGLPGWVGWTSPVAAAGATGVAALAWRAGIRHYRSTGS